MHFLNTVIPLALLASTGLATSKVHNINVGPGLAFKPSSITAAKGDTVNFHFFSGDHSVAQSSYGKPCVPIGSKAIYSGFLNPSGSSEDSTMFSMKVNVTTPIWLYCSRFGHCQNGMSMVINPPKASTKKTLTKYQAASQGQSEVSPAKVFGGVLVPNKGG